MLAGIAEGTSELSNFALAADCHSTLGCMKALGAEVKVEKTLVRVTGRGLRGLKSSWRALDARSKGSVTPPAISYSRDGGGHAHCLGVEACRGQ